ncbi:hypothetical protein BWD13_13115 [Leptospira santarosai serovar Grippotyphosa]|nr:hypothetical protein BWD13_13115 [Leptospira santarosai serovar Grippotyphosa]
MYHADRIDSYTMGIFGLIRSYITRCPKFCFKTEIGLKMNGTYSVEMNSANPLFRHRIIGIFSYRNQRKQ